MNPALIPIFTQLFNTGVTALQNAKARKYNSPQQQIQRFRAAGISPNAIFTNANAGNYNPLAIPGMPTNWYNEHEKNMAAADQSRAAAKWQNLETGVYSRTNDQGVTVLGQQVLAGIEKTIQDKKTGAAQESLAQEQTRTEQQHQKLLGAQTITQGTIQKLNNMSANKIEQETKNLQQELRNSQEMEKQIKAATALLDIQETETRRAFNFAKEMEDHQIAKIGAEIEEMYSKIAGQYAQSNISLTTEEFILAIKDHVMKDGKFSPIQLFQLWNSYKIMTSIN